MRDFTLRSFIRAYRRQRVRRAALERRYRREAEGMAQAYREGLHWRVQ